MDNKVLHQARAKAVILLVVLITVSLFSISCGGGATAAVPEAAAPAALSLSPSNLAFGNLPLESSSSSQTVTLTNSGGVALGINSIALTGTHACDFVQVNTCGTSVAPSGHCTISVTFRPSASGSRTASVSISDSASGGAQTVSLSGIGTAAGVTLSTANLPFGNQPVGTSSTAQTVSLTNSGSTVLNISSIALSGANASDFAQTNTCSNSVAAAASCTLSVTFSPSAIGSRAASLIIADTAPGSPRSVTLSGTGGAPAFTPSADSLSFGNQLVGAMGAAQTETVTNSGSAGLTITSVSLTGPNAGDFTKTTDSCSGMTLIPNGTCAVSVNFTPGGSGPRSAVLSFADNVSGGPQSVSLTGTGGNPVPSLSTLWPASASVGAAAQTLTINGTNFLSSSTVTYNGMPHAATHVNAAQLTISLSAPDQATAGTYSVVVANPTPGGGASNVLSFSVTGTGVNLSPANLIFSNQAIDMTGPAQTATLTNTGSTALSITGISLTGAYAGDFGEIDTCGSSLRAGGNCTIAVIFTPTGAGPRTASLSIADSAGGSPQVVSLSGTGIHDVILSWTASLSPGVMGYNVYRGATSGGQSPTPLNSTPINGITYPDGSVTAGARYYYVVTAVDASGVTQSVASQEASATVPSP